MNRATPAEMRILNRLSSSPAACAARDEVHRQIRRRRWTAPAVASAADRRAYGGAEPANGRSSRPVVLSEDFFDG